MSASQASPTDWRNWAGNQSADGIEVVTPSTADEVAPLLAGAGARGRRVRPIGSSHSFTAIGRPEHVQLRLDRLDRVLHADTATGLVTVEAGIRLSALNRALDALGLAMTNLGDIDEQTLAGAISTGTHGTGARFGGLATQVRALVLALPDGSTLTCSPEENPEVFAVARVGLGALGVVTAVTLQTEPAFGLHAREGSSTLDEVLERFDEDAATTDHVEFYWFPHTRRVLTKHNTRVGLDDLAPLSRRRAWWDDDFLSNTVFGGLVGAGRRVPALVRPLARVSASALGDRAFSDVSHRVLTSPRRVRFEEMEYAVPREHGLDVVRELVRAVERSRWGIAVPVEVRVAAADDIALSTAEGRDTLYVAVHTAPGSPDRAAYFATLEAIAGDVGGRPHWGKLHGLDAADLRERYPRFEELRALRDRLDPQRVLGNDHLAHVLGP
ncbi:D-arabinono-1,4-lactone oxidase [Nocardioides sp.]|uniref:D-arabinono-1,4-lactone oxidase n=1 Tax=Nocardioides sp. TaxID=35761 RepID=UPI002720DBD0|nr:D-arabinono-1,4-lactone oxidase [Nocardioides sp.]MDO9455025.1 D-arabinono-1,4-lactone oxidase [Nocardioides sp.]